jgi:hypothetical protein
MTRMTWRSTDPTAALKSNWNKNAQVYPRDAYRPGLIIRAFLYEQAYAKGPIPDTQASTIIDISPDKEPLCAKNRFSFVVAAHQGNYTAIPLYTHQGNGLANKQFKEEYISVRDHRKRNPSFVAQSRHDPLLTAELNEKVKIDEKTTAWLTYPISRSYLLPVMIEGCLDGISTEALVRLYTAYAPKEDMLSSGEQGDVAETANRLRGMRIRTGMRIGMEARSFASSKMGHAMRAR